MLSFTLKKYLLVITLIAILSASCRIYKFSGISISSEVKTISIAHFPNNASFVVPTLSQDLTEALKDKFISETSLVLIERNGDLNIAGSITNYNITPVAPTANETALLNRLTITIKVSFVNSKEENQDWEKSFSRFTEFDSSVNISDIELQLIDEINAQLIEDVFNKAVVNW
ncbi:MAG: LptE family protein [Bacteroidetes bacterium]|nr:LptE family protein [Bacteroidota bacterium]